MSKNGKEGVFPSWPEGAAGTPLLSISLNKPVDEVFLMFHGGETEFKKKCNEALCNKDYATCPWQPSQEEAERALGTPAPPPDPASLKPGLVRKATYSSSAMGVKFKNEEVMRLVEVSPGQGYVVEYCVATTATYGDKFRPVLRHTLRALGDGRTALRVVSMLVFVKSVNGLLKGMVEKGAKDGMAKNLSVVRKVLEGFATVSEAPSGLGPAAAAPKRVAAAPVAQGEALPPPPPMLDAVAGVSLVQHLRPWAQLLHRLVEPYPVVGGLDAEGLLVALVALCLLATLRLVVDVLRFVDHASEDPQDMVAWLAHYVFKVSDFPDNTREVLSACVLLYLVRALVNRLAHLLPGPPPPAEVAPATQPEPASAPAAGAGPAATPAATAKAAPMAMAAAAAAAASAAAPKSRSVLSTPPPPAPPAGGLPPGAALGSLSSMSMSMSLSPVSDGEDLQGVQYEGYAQAIAGMDQQVREGENALVSPEPSSWSASAQRLNEQMSHQTYKAMSRLKGNFREFKRSVKALTGSTPSASKSADSMKSSPDKQEALGGVEAVAGGAATSPALQGLGRFSSEPLLEGAEGSSEEEQEGHSATALPPPTAPSDILPSPSPSATNAHKAMHKGSAPPRMSLTAEVAAAAATVAATAAAAGATAPSAAAMPGATMPSEGSPSPSRRASATSEGGTPSASGRSFFSLKKLSRMSAFGEQTPASSKKGEGVLSPEVMSPRTSSSDWEMGMSTGRLQSTPPHLMPAGVLPELQPHAITAEVFENQRLQPFRGWGSTWPGHFLPTDKVNRWSLREVPGLPVRASQEFDQVAPQPPEGWSWVEDKWRIDSNGRDTEAVDDDGWAYGLDFGWVQGAPMHPFQPNQGKKKVTDFVRRRRWIRTLVPDPSLLPSLQQPSAPRPPSSAASKPPVAPAAPTAVGAAAAPGARRALEGALATAQAGTAGEEAGGSVKDGMGPGPVATPPPSPPKVAVGAGPLAAAAASIPLVPLPRAGAVALGLPTFDAGHLSTPPPPASKQVPVTGVAQAATVLAKSQPAVEPAAAEEVAARGVKEEEEHSAAAPAATWDGKEKGSLVGGAKAVEAGGSVEAAKGATSSEVRTEAQAAEGGGIAVEAEAAPAQGGEGGSQPAGSEPTAAARSHAPAESPVPAAPAARMSTASESTDAEAGVRVDQLLSELSSSAGEEQGRGLEQMPAPEGKAEEAEAEGWEGEDLDIN